MNSLDIQRKRKMEKQGYYKNNPHKKEPPMFSESDCQIIGIVIISAILLIGLLVGASIASKNSKNDCEQVGGKYEVVDTTFVGKSVVDIYSCVK